MSGPVYRVKEIFRTLQGEGHYAGMPAVFVRFGGCNLWSGLNEDRGRDSKRHNAKCPLFCDTDFRGGDSFEEDVLVDVVAGCAPKDYPLIVFTGGEPLLQLRASLLKKLRKHYKRSIFAIETNGATKYRDGVEELLDWVCVSPKVAEPDIVIRQGGELKIVYPNYDPLAYATIAPGFIHRLVSPCATMGPKSELVADNMTLAANFVMEHPQWRLSTQQHKLIGLR